MGNEASQEGGEGAPQQAPQQQRPVPPLVTQQSMPLPASQEVVPPPESGGGRRGSAGPQLMMRRASSTGVPPPPVGAAGSKRGSIVEIPTELDLSNLSEEERATILSVMARAQSMEEDLPPPAPKEEEIEKREPEKEIEKCSLCRASPKEGSCVECGALCCRKCSKAIPSGKKHVWMCVRCVDRYPQLQSTINKKEPSVTNDEVPADRRRRASEVTPHPAGSVQQQGLPPARGRSDSLPSQKPRMQQRTLPSQRPDLPQQRYPNDVQGQRPQGPQQNSSPRPQHPQQVRPRHPSDQQKGHRASGPPRPQHPNDQQRFPHPNEQQRFPHPNEQQRFPHPNEQQRFQHPNEQQRFQHPNDQQRFPHPSDQQRFPHPSDQQRFPHTNDQQKFAHPNGQVKAQHPIEHLDKQYPDQLVQKQHKTNDHHRDHYANEPQQSQMHMDQRTQHPTDSKNQNVLDERIQQSPQQSRNISVEQQRIQNSNHRDQITNEKKVSSSENRYQNDHGKSQNLVEPPRSLHDQKHSSDQQRAQHTVDQPRSKPLNGQSQPKYAHEQFGHPIELHQKSLTAEQRTTDQRPQHPFSQQQEIQRMQHSAETNSHLANNMQVSMQKSQQHDEHYNSQHPKYHTEKEADYFQQQMGPQNDPMRPRPQHPLTQPNQNLPPEGTVQSYPQKPPVVQEFLPLRPQAPDVSQMTPPPRNQRLRQPPEQQMVPKPQHPQQSTQELVHYPQVIFENNAKASEKDSHNQDSHKFQTQHELATDKQKDQNQISKHQNIPERAHSKQLNGQQFPPESIKKAGNRYVQDGSGQQHLIEEGNLDEARRQDIMQKQFNQMPESLPHDKTVFAQRQNPPNRQTVPRPTETMQSTTLDNDKNGLYVSLNEQIPCQSAGLLNQDLLRQFPQQHQNVIRSDNTTPSPPATLPRTKPPEIPQPASRTRRDKPESGNQTLPRSGTNPFRTDTNPFRRESLPAEAIDAGEYVTVAPRRGSLDDKMKLMSTHDQNRLNDRIKPSESCSMQKDKGLEDQDPFEKSKNSQETDAFTQSMYNRHLDEERRRNAINSGISVSDSNSRRQLPSIEKQKKQPLVPYVEQGQVPPVPKMRTSLPETSFGESRNGIPRTVPLTSLTLQQQNDQVHGHFKQSDDLNQGEKDKMVINDLSQLREENDSRCALRQDQQKLRDDLVHPNIVVENSANSSAHQIERNTEGPSKPKPPPTQPRKKSDAQRDQTNSDSYRGKAQGQQGWSEFPHDQRKNKPIHPNDNLQDIAGYQDEEEEEDIDDYFQMIENAITDRKPQVIVGGRKTSDIQRQLFNKEVDKDHAKAGVSEYVLQKGQVTATLRQIDAYNQNQIQQSKPISSSKQQPTVYGQRNTIETVKEKNDLNMYEQDKILSSKKDFYDIDEADYTRDKKDSQYIIQPTDQRSNHSVTQEEYGKAKPEYTKGYDKLLLHELTPDTRQPSAKHYLEEHKTQPVSYEAFSSAKAMQQMQVDPRQQQYAMQQQKFSQQQVKDAENRNQQAYYYSQQYSGSSYQSMGSSDDSYDSENSMKGQPSSSSKPSAIDLQNQKKPKPKPDPQDWSPVSDLSPILDVSPSIEAAEQELMEKFQEKGVEDQEIDLVEEDDSRLLKAGGIPRAKSGTISGMLEEFTRALGLPGTSPLDDSGIKSAVSPTSLAMSPISNVGSSVSTVSTLQKEYQDGFGSPQKTTSGSPQKTPAQPTTPRRSHRRLPQPTVEQMQAAVAMAAQGPRDKPQQPESTTTGDVLFGVEANKGSTNGCPTSPVMTWKSPDMNQSFELAYNKQQGQPSQETQVTVPPSPAPRAQPRSNNNTQKVNEVNQIALTPNSQDASQVRRLRSASYGGSPSAKPSEDIVARLNGGGSSSPHGTNNVFSDIIATTVGSPQTPSTPRDKTGDSSDTQSEAESIKSVRLRRKLPNLPQDQSPSPSPTRKTLEKGKNGIDFQDSLETESSSPVPASAVTVTTTVTTSLETSKQYSPLSALGTPSPQPVGGSLSPLLGRRTELSRTPSPGGEAGTKLPQYMQSLKQQLRDELKAVTEERKVMLEQRGKERGDGERAKTPQPLISVEQPSTESKEDIETLVVSEPHSPYQTQSVSPTRAVPQSQQIMQSQMFPQTPQMTPTSQAQIKPVQQMISQSQYQPQILSPYRTHPTHHQSNQSLYQSPSSNVPQQQVHYQAQTYAQQEQMLYQTLQETGRRTPQPVQARTPLPDAVPQYAGIHRANDDDITIMTTATTTVVSASEQWHDGKRQRQPPTTTMAPSAALMGSSVESLRRLQAKMSPQPSPKKGRRRHTSEITVPPFPQMEQHEMAHTLHHPPRQQQQPPQYIQYYTQLQGQTAGYRSMEFKSVDSHVRATDLLRSSASRYGGSLGSGLGSTEALYQGRRVLNNKLQDYMTDNRIMEQQQRLVGPDAYFQTLNNEINRLRRSSESLHRDTMYDKPVWGGPPMQSPLPAAETRTSPQTTERRKRKEKKSRKPRSWHPSPYVSEDEDDQLTREEKKAKIKAEIARRRQQIEENMRLHDELCKLAERRDRLDPGRTGSVSYVPSPTGSVAYMAQEAPLGPPRTSQDGDDTSSVLKAIDEILRKDLYSGPLSRSAWATYANPSEVRTDEYYQQGYLTMPARGRYEYTPTSELRPSSSWYEDEATQQYHHQHQQQQQQQQQMQQRASPQVGQYFQETTADPETAMDESIARIASTFPTDEPPDILLSATPGHFSPETTPAMPLLPDMPTRSRKLLENLGSSPIQPSRSGSAQSLYQERSGDEECTDDGSLGHRMQESSSLLRTQQRKSSRAPVSKTSQKYEFPVKRILLTRDPKDRSVSGNGLGMKVVGGKEVPGSNGMIGAYVAKIFPGGVVETLGEVKEGDQVLEWNGIPLTGRTYEEVQRIIASSADEVEIVIRCDLNMLENMGRQRRSSPGMGTSGGPRGDGSGTGGPPGRGPSPAHSPYSPSPRGQSPALSKRGMGGGGTTSGGGANVVGVTTHSGSIPTSLSGASSYENLQTPDQGFGHRFGRGFLNTAPTSRSVVSVLAPSTDWPDIYDSAIYSSPQSPDDFLDDSFQTHWQTGSNIEEMQFQVCCGPRTAIVYVPIVPVRPMLKNSTPALLNRNHFTRRSVDHLDDYEPLLKNGWRTNEKTLGFYDLLRPRNSFGKVSLYLNGIKEKTEHYDLKKKNGMCRVTEIKEETRERPRAPSDLPGLKPVFVNDWKGHRKTKHEENDDNNNTKTSHSQPSGEKPRKPCVGSSPEATPYNILPKGCRGSFCIIL